jgi:hypothetical protein
MGLSFDQLILAPCMNTFGEVNQGYPIPTYYPRLGEPFELNGVFDHAYREHVIQDGLPVTVTMPVFGVRASDCVIYPEPDDEISIRGKTYVVREARPDSHGHIKLMLNFSQDYQSP